MLKTGVFTTPTDLFVFYEIIERGFYRIDFTTKTAAFHTDYSSVLYSQVRRKSTYVIGDSTIYDEFERVREKMESAQKSITKNATWENGCYIVRQEAVSEKLGIKVNSVLKNGELDSITMIMPDYTISESVVDAVYGVKLLPLNFQDYEEIHLSKDTIVASDGGLFYSLDVLKRRYDLRHIEEKDYVVATDIETAKRRLHEFDTDPWPFKGFDTETTGTDVCMYGDDHLVGVILGDNPMKATYFPFRHVDDINLPIEFLKELMEVVIKHQDHCVAHNKKFDREVMLKEGFDVHVKWDTMQLSIILNPTIGKGIHGEKYLIQQLNGRHFLELDEIFVNAKDIDFSVLPVDIIKYYACPDGTNVLDLIEDQFKRLPKYQYRLAELECDLADVKADQEYYGIRVDTKKFEKQYRRCNNIIEILLKAFRTLTHEDGNINSTQVLSNLMYNKMHCKVLLRTSTGQASTSSAAIKKLASIQKKNSYVQVDDLLDNEGKVIIKGKDLANSAYPALLILSKYREYNKLKTAFYSRFERTMKTGRIFFWINQNGAATGRQSSPMHQLPPELKEVILSDAEDRDFWGPDFSQVELRMIAYLAKEKELIELAKDPDNDIHRIIGSLISGKPMWAITPAERSAGKRRNFGVVYLISKFGLAGQLFGPGYTKENVDFAGQQLDDFYHRFKRIDRFIKGNAALVQKRGYMETAWYHRRRLFNEIFDPDIEPSKKASILRMANNVPVQGTAADYLKLAEVQMDKWIRLKGWNKIKDGFPRVRMMLSIHDEIIISADNTIPYEEIIEMITRCMETPVEEAPPFFVQPALMDNWEGHSDDAVAMPIRYRDKVIADYNKTGKSVFKQSYFKLQLPEEAVLDLTKNERSVSYMIDTYLNGSKLVFDHGNYTNEYTQEHLKDAIKRFVESGFTIYRIDNYLKLLDEFRQSQLHDYMSDLIRQYGLDGEAVGAHVRHPSLTFALLDTYKKRISYDLEHEQRITEAAKLYIEDVKNGSIDSGAEFVANIKEDVAIATDKDTYSQQLEPLVDLDEDGNVLYEDSSDNLEDVYSLYYDEAPDDIINICNNKPVYVWEMADIIVFDCGDLHQDDIDKVLAYIFEHKESDGFYRVFLIYNGNMVDTKMRIENLDIGAANDVILRLISLAA